MKDVNPPRLGLVAQADGDVRPIMFCLIEPTFSRPKIFFYGAFLCQSCRTNRKKKKTEGPSAGMKKKGENTTVLNEQKTHYLRIQMLADLSVGIL